jgi:chromosome segregation ATPase
MVVDDRTVIDLQILGRNIVDLRAAVGRLERELAGLTLAYREVKGDIAGIDLQLGTMIGLADKRHADNLAEFGAIHRELDTLRDGVAGLRGEVAELRGEVAELRAGQQELRGEVAELRAGQQATDRSIASLTAMIAKIHDKLGI